MMEISVNQLCPLSMFIPHAVRSRSSSVVIDQRGIHDDLYLYTKCFL